MVNFRCFRNQDLNHSLDKFQMMQIIPNHLLGKFQMILNQTPPNEAIFLNH